MRTFLILSILCFFAATSVYAVGPALYIGGALQVSSPTGSFSSTNLSSGGGGAKSDAGGEIDLGLTSKGGSVYAGYRFGQMKASSEAKNGYTLKVEKWKLDRIVVGARWHVFGTTGLPIVPTLGAGVTFGSPRADLYGQHGASRAIENYNETAKSAVGWFVELGGILRPPGPLSVIADIQYHSFNTKFDATDFNQTFNISFVTIQAGVRYELSIL